MHLPFEVLAASLGLAILAAAAAPFCAAQQTEPKEEVVEAPRHCLWRISQGEGTVYLLGAIHVLSHDSYPLPAPIERAYNESERVVLETDLGAFQTPEMQARMSAANRLSDGRVLRQVVSGETYNTLQAKLVELGLSPPQYENLKPQACALMLMMTQLGRLGFSQHLGIDRHFLARAKTDGKAVAGLESPEEHLALFTELGATDGEEFLLQTLHGLAVLQDMLDDVRKLWRAGDTTRLADIIRAEFEDYPHIYQRFVLARNRKWQPQIEAFLEAGETVLVIVGVGHLVGEGNLIESLRRTGCRVKQL